MSDTIFARDLDGTGSMHVCSDGDEGAVEYTRTDTGWQPIDSYKGGRVLLSVYVNAKAVTAIGGYDDTWSGECWVYESPKIPTGQQPTKWQHLPTP